MIRAALTALALLCFAAPAVAAPAIEPGSVVRRTTLLVADADRSIAFYRDVLGFELWLDRASKSIGQGKLPLNVRPGASRLVVMKGRDPWVGMIGLLEYSEPALAENRRERDQLGAGGFVLMVETDDIARVQRELVAKGGRLLAPAEEFETRAGDGSPLRAITLFMQDPDGFVIEATQRLPAKAP